MLNNAPTDEIKQAAPSEQTVSPIAYADFVKLGDIEASLMIHRTGTRMLTFTRSSGVTGERYVSFTLHLTADDIVALQTLLAGAVTK